MPLLVNPNEKPFFVNGYEIKFNPYWNEFQVSHYLIGANIAAFETITEAVEFAEKG